LIEKLLQSYIYNYKSEYDFKLCIVAQGYSDTDKNEVSELIAGCNGQIEMIYDDTMFRKGLSISEIRDYFTSKYFMKSSEFIYFCDDDFVFRERSLKILDRTVEYMKCHPAVGLINFFFKGQNFSDDPNESVTDHNMSVFKVGMRSGILVRRSAYHGWGSEEKIIYYEEAWLGTMVYVNGWDVLRTATDTIHRTIGSGLGKSIEKEYENNFEECNGGRQVLHRLGFQISAERNGVHNFKSGGNLSEKSISLHNENRKKLFGNSSVTWGQFILGDVNND
jgi:hypothetical protein